MNVIQRQPWEATLLVLGVYSTPVTGITAAELTLRIRKYGDTTFTSSTLPSASWVEIGEGWYVLKLTAAQLDRVGPFFYELAGAPIIPVYGEYAVWPPPLPSVQPGRCIVTGTITDITGTPVILPAKISFRLADSPLAIQGVFVQGGYYETRADAYGNFAVNLIRGTRVVVEIEHVGIKATVVVPDTDTVPLIDILPPLPPPGPLT